MNQYICKLEHQLHGAKRNGFVVEEESSEERRNPFLSDELSDPVFPIDATAETHFDHQEGSELDRQPAEPMFSLQRNTTDLEEVSLAATEVMQQQVQMHMDQLWDNDTSVVLLLVFQHLTIQDLVQVSAVCQQWREVSRQPSLWRHVCLNTDSVHSNVRQYFASASSVRWYTCTEMDRQAVN